MNGFEEILAVGGKSNSLGRASEVLEAVRSDLKKLPELFDCIYADDAWVRMRAIDTFEKIVKDNPACAQPYIPKILKDLTRSTQPSIQWHLAQLFAEIELDKTQQRAAVQWLKERITTTEVDWIVSVNTMKTLLSFCECGLTKISELRSLFTLQTKHSSATVRKKAALFLEQLK